MTNAQLLSAAKELVSQGKISQTDEAQLTAIAYGADSTPINGNGSSASQTLSDPTLHNFIAEVQGIDYDSHHIAGSVGAAMYDRLLKDLEANQGSSTGDSTKTFSIQVQRPSKTHPRTNAAGSPKIERGFT
jgi:hypothetical protein